MTVGGSPWCLITGLPASSNPVTTLFIWAPSTSDQAV
jgi:hypothetical protein